MHTSRLPLQVRPAGDHSVSAWVDAIAEAARAVDEGHLTESTVMLEKPSATAPELTPYIQSYSHRHNLNAKPPSQPEHVTIAIEY